MINITVNVHIHVYIAHINHKLYRYIAIGIYLRFLGVASNYAWVTVSSVTTLAK